MLEEVIAAELLKSTLVVQIEPFSSYSVVDCLV
jgi:hypothetical protein